MQGAADGLVYPDNTEFARPAFRIAPSLSIQIIAGRGHLIAFPGYARIKREIQRMFRIKGGKKGKSYKPERKQWIAWPSGTFLPVY